MTAGGHRYSTGSYEGGRVSPAPLLGHPAPPYSCVVVAQPLINPASAAAAAAAAAAAFVSPLTPPAFRSETHNTGGTPPSPCCPPGCSCGVSSGSASSLGACRVHERLISCPAPPPPVTSGTTDRDSVRSLPGCDGEIAIPCDNEQEVWQTRDDTSEEIKEESVKELLIRFVLKLDHIDNEYIVFRNNFFVIEVKFFVKMIVFSYSCTCMRSIFNFSSLFSVLLASFCFK